VADLPSTLPDLPYDHTPPGWRPLAIPRAAYLDEVEALVRFAVQHQSESGAIIDPLLEREHQYSTPYFAFAAGALLHEGRADDLRDAAVRAMDHATESFAQGAGGIPDRHGEFYIAPLVGALELYEKVVPHASIERWRERLRTPIYEVIDGPQEHRNNWRTYAMKGEWLRAQAGLADRDETYDLVCVAVPIPAATAAVARPSSVSARSESPPEERSSACACRMNNSSNVMVSSCDRRGNQSSLTSRAAASMR